MRKFYEVKRLKARRMNKVKVYELVVIIIVLAVIAIAIAGIANSCSDKPGEEDYLDLNDLEVYEDPYKYQSVEVDTKEWSGEVVSGQYIQARETSYSDIVITVNTEYLEIYCTINYDPNTNTLISSHTPEDTLRALYLAYAYANYGSCRHLPDDMNEPMNVKFAEPQNHEDSSNEVVE